MFKTMIRLEGRQKDLQRKKKEKSKYVQQGPNSSLYFCSFCNFVQKSLNFVSSGASDSEAGGNIKLKNFSKTLLD